MLNLILQIAMISSLCTEKKLRRISKPTKEYPQGNTGRCPRYLAQLPRGNKIHMDTLGVCMSPCLITGSGQPRQPSLAEGPGKPWHPGCSVIASN